MPHRLQLLEVMFPQEELSTLVKSTGFSLSSVFESLLSRLTTGSWAWLTERTVIPLTGIQFSSVAQWCPILCHPMDCSMLGFPVLHSLLEFAQTMVKYREAWCTVIHGVTKNRTHLSNFTFIQWRRKWQPTPVFLPGESQGRGSLVGCCL